jgi:4-amino-4-deoxy-L-arabinose transferase-like glycosyltransferase
VGGARASAEGDLASRNGGRIGLAVLAAILLLGLALRVDYAWEGREPVYDAAAYARIAANLEAGEGFTAGPDATQPSSNYSPGLPLLVAGIYEVAGGEDERLARLALAAIGSLAVLFAYLIGRRLAGPAAGLIGAGAVAIYPALLEYGGMLMGEPMAATLLSGAMLALFWASDGERLGRWLLPGALLGALALTRPEYLGVGLLLTVVVFAIDARDEWRASLGRAAILLAGLALVVAPWTLRNAVALDRFVPISTGGGQVLFAGSYLPSDGDPERVGREVLERHPGLTRRLAIEGGDGTGGVDGVLVRLRLEQILAALASQRYPELETDRALARMGRERLWDDITEEPVAYAGFLAAKVWRLWGHGPREVMRRPAWELLHWALIALAAVGLAFLIARRRWEAIPLLAVILAITAISAVLVASPRRVLVMLPLISALAGVGAVACRDSLARRWNA